MFPTTIRNASSYNYTQSSSSSSSSSSFFPEYFHRLLTLVQMDFDFGLSQLIDLLLRPTELYKTTAIRKQIKNQWARDDPAVTVIVAIMVLISSCCYLLCFNWNYLSIYTILRYTIGIVLIEYILLGIIICSLIRFIVNNSMRIHRLYSVDQHVEWLYSFDIHCNAFFTAFILLGPIQYILIPIIINNTTNSSDYLSTIIGNSIYLLSGILYIYQSFLGYSSLPFVERADRFLYSIIILISIIGLLTICNYSIAQHILTFYYGI